jgi:hypothetical protein
MQGSVVIFVKIKRTFISKLKTSPGPGRHDSIDVAVFIEVVERRYQVALGFVAHQNSGPGVRIKSARRTFL